jgi:hypothetical protein
MNLANGTREPQPKNYDGSASMFNMANYGVYGLTLGAIGSILWGLIQTGLSKK